MINVSYDVFTETFLAKITEYNFIRLDAAHRSQIVDGYMKRAWAQFVSTCRFNDKFRIITVVENEDGVADDDLSIGADDAEELDDVSDVGVANPTVGENDITTDDTDDDSSDDDNLQPKRTEEFVLDIDEPELDEIVEIITEGMLVQWMKQYMYKQENLENMLNTNDFSSYSPAELLYRVTNAYNMCKKDFLNMMREYSFNHGDLTDLHL